MQACTTAMGGPLSPAALARLFERIIDEARRLERQSAGRHDEREADVLGGGGTNTRHRRDVNRRPCRALTVDGDRASRRASSVGPKTGL